jgi:hypothetical protein
LVNDVTPLKNLFNLNTLDLSSNDISDFSPLKNIKSLEYLNTSDNLFEDEDFALEPNIQPADDEVENAHWFDREAQEGDIFDDGYDQVSAEIDNLIEANADVLAGSSDEKSEEQDFGPFDQLPEELAHFLNQIHGGNVTVKKVASLETGGPGAPRGLVIKCRVTVPELPGGDDTILKAITSGVLKSISSHADLAEFSHELSQALESQHPQTDNPVSMKKFSQNDGNLDFMENDDERKEFLRMMNQMIFLLNFNPNKYSIH